MNIVLINPYFTLMDKNVFCSEPLGLLYLAAYADKVFGNSINIQILDLYALNPKKLRNGNGTYIAGVSDEKQISVYLNELDADLIGISCNFTTNYLDVIDLSHKIKKNFPSIPIVIGGAHTTIEGYSIMKEHETIDYAVLGEGEIVFENLIRAFKKEITFSEIKGLIFRDDKQNIIINEPQELIEDLAVLPIPNRDLVDYSKYMKTDKKIFWQTKQTPLGFIMTSRGCPYNCAFCSTNVVWRRKWRPIPLKNVFQEIETLYNKYGIREIVILDDQFIGDKDRIHNFCDYFIEKELNLTFSAVAGLSPWLVDMDLLIKMKKAGFYSASFPVESGCEKTLKYIKKPVNLDKVRKLIKDATELGLWTMIHIIIGFPYETKEDLEESIRYAYDSGVDFTHFFIAKPHAGSEMYKDFQKSGLLPKAITQGSGFYIADYDTNFLKSEEIHKINNRASMHWFMHKLFFYIKPGNFIKYFLPKINTWSGLKYFLKLLYTVPATKIIPKLFNR